MAIGYNTTVVRNGLVLHLDAANVKSYPGSGTVWTDLSSNGNNGTLTNGVGYSANNKGSLVFDGVDDRVLVTRTIQDNFTILCWFKTTQSFQSSSTAQWYHGAGLVDAEVAGVQNDFGISLQAGKIDFGVGNPDVTIRSLLTYNDNVWHCAVGTRNKATGAINLYVDGNFIISGIANTSSLTGPSNICIGSLQTNLNFFSGNISTVQLYNRDLTAQEIRQNFEALRGRYGI